MKQLLLATRNAHKTEEVVAMLEGCFKVADLSTFPDAPEVEETGVTFGENSTLKAVAISKVSKSLVLADDSGLEVDALQGSPGVYSARFAGPDADDPANNQKLLTELTDVPMEQRTARFRCVMVLWPGPESPWGSLKAAWKGGFSRSPEGPGALATIRSLSRRAMCSHSRSLAPASRTGSATGRGP